MYSLVKNEAIKMMRKKRLYIVLGILLVMITAFAYGQYHSLDRTREQLARRVGAAAAGDWRRIAEQQIIDMKNRLDSPYMDQQNRATTRVRMEQLQYYLDNDINPVDITGARFTTRFIEQSIYLFLPLLVILLSADLVSGELSGGTIKLLLVRGVSRWRILLGKYISLLLLELNVLFFALLFSVLVSGVFFGYGGWEAPVATGFQVVDGRLITSSVVNVPQWQYLLMVYGLAYYVAVVVGTVSFMISVLVKSTAASIGIILSTLIGGTFLSGFMADWKLPRYLFMSNLRLTDYISGSLRPIEGMNMGFSLTVLAVWTVAAIVVSFWYFTRRDILV
ncbi:MAG: ABC transporter permease [Firmicutes bacterium]|nr:ABC transporter permease [Bacillota bacterium]